MLQIKEDTISLSTGEMPYIRFGSGARPFVLITGMSMTGLAGLAEPVAAAYRCFTDDYTVYLFDRIAYLPDGYTVRDMARDVAESMRRLGLDAADVMGVSQGGMIALRLAIDAPDLVRALVLGSSCCRQNDISRETLRLWSDLADRGDGDGIYRDFLSRVYTDAPADLLASFLGTATADQCRRFGILARACAAFDCQAEVSQVRCPVLAIGAQKDRVLGATATEDAAKLLGCDWYIYPDYGHSVYDEAPDFKERVLRFLRGIR